MAHKRPPDLGGPLFSVICSHDHFLRRHYPDQVRRSVTNGVTLSARLALAPCVARVLLYVFGSIIHRNLDYSPIAGNPESLEIRDRTPKTCGLGHVIYHLPLQVKE